MKEELPKNVYKKVLVRYGRYWYGMEGTGTVCKLFCEG